MARPRSLELTLQDDHHRLANFLGPVDQNLRQIEEAFDVRITRRNAQFTIVGDPLRANAAAAALKHFLAIAHRPLALEEVQLGLVELRPTLSEAMPNHPEPERAGTASVPAAQSDTPPVLQTRRTDLRGRTPVQREYLRQILNNDITFGIGPAGTGKTYLAVACAVDALERDVVKRIVLTRPAVEAGERLGFLPGDLAQKVDPYLRPLYDALYDLMGFDRVGRMFEKQAIEIAPLAYMRGRTLNNAFIILDEAQNTTPEQMKMFLTRIGFGSRAVVTGDSTQVDLPRGARSGLGEAARILEGIQGIAFSRFSSADVVRHPLVARIVDAYEKAGQADQQAEQG
jgi:phosphate starvation-inducible PhoH-like protein